MNTSPLWPAPTPTAPISGTVTVPGSKSETNRALVIAALAASPSTITGALRARDTLLMEAALTHLGARITATGPHLHITPIPGTDLPADITIDTGLAGTVMRFIPPLAALTSSRVHLDGDAAARRRPLHPLADALTQLGATVTAPQLPLTVIGPATGSHVTIDSSSSSQFISALLLAGAAYPHGLTITHAGGPLPSLPHIEMTVDMLIRAGVNVTRLEETSWHVPHTAYPGLDMHIEPDLSNAAVFLVAAAVTGGTVTISGWPTGHTTQPGALLLPLLEHMGCQWELSPAGLTLTGPPVGTLHGISADLTALGEVAPTLAAACALATGPSTLTGIGHVRGHETDRLAALTAELTRIGCGCVELADGLEITPPATREAYQPQVWRSYEDHRMATAGAIIGLLVPGMRVENIATTAKTMPEFPQLWEDLLDAA
ncbi:MAG: 3-phosphoshikimate 1-carboxyvinyltransferase [Corynebacterium sp.]|nr:3-phosphoshikimate 1-carboxyvinyltransferase [Corynebacterium sp.]